MEQQIRICTTPDRVRLAYAAHGQGLPLVKAATWMRTSSSTGRAPSARLVEMLRTQTAPTIETVGPVVIRRHAVA